MSGPFSLDGGGNWSNFVRPVCTPKAYAAVLLSDEAISVRLFESGQRDRSVVVSQPEFVRKSGWMVLGSDVCSGTSRSGGLRSEWALTTFAI